MSKTSSKKISHSAWTNSILSENTKYIMRICVSKYDNSVFVGVEGAFTRIGLGIDDEFFTNLSSTVGL